MSMPPIIVPPMEPIPAPPPGFATPETVSQYLITADIEHCCIYTFVDYWMFNGMPNYPPGSAYECPLGHVNVVRLPNGKWGPVNRERYRVKYTGPVEVVFTHPDHPRYRRG